MKRDPALASERTVLAWQRFALALAVVGALGVRAGIARGHEVLGFLVAAGVAGAAALLQVGGPRMGSTTAVRVALAATLTAAAGALAIALT